MKLESEFDYCEVFVSNADNAVCLQDETGEAVYLDAKMAKELIPALQHFIATGALPE